MNGSTTKTEGPIDISEHALVIVQYESLGRITGLERTKTTLVVVLDEFNSLCNQMDSTYGDVVMAQKRFYDLFKYSDHIIASDSWTNIDWTSLNAI